MPELPEVEQARKLFERCCIGRCVLQCHVEQDLKVFEGVSPNDFAKHLKGQRITGAGRKGKQLWVELERRPWPLIHLGMTGSFASIDNKGKIHTAHYVNSKVDASSWPPKFWKFHLLLDDGCRVAFIAIRRFERVKLLQDPPNEPPVSRLGFDPLTGMIAVEAFAAALRARSGPVKGALLDQSLCAGVGNWIADEVLYQAKLHPETACKSLTNGQIAALHLSLSFVVSTACSVEGESANFPKDWLFHFRWTGKKASTTCDGKTIAFSTVASRTTAWVPAVQRKTERAGGEQVVAEGELGATGPSEERHNVEVQDKKKTKAKTIATLAATGAGARGATAATAATAATVARKAVARKTPASKGGEDAEVEEGKADGVGEELVHALQQKKKKKKAEEDKVDSVGKIQQNRKRKRGGQEEHVPLEAAACNTRAPGRGRGRGRGGRGK